MSDTEAGPGAIGLPGTAAPVTVAVFDDYPSVQQAVDHLADHGFPVDRVSIVGRDLRYVEHVTGRMTVATAAALGALQGAVLGALFALGFGMIFTFSPNPALPLLVVYGIVAGAALGALFGALSHAAGGGRRDFTSVPTMVADHYALVVGPDVADRAAALLRDLGATADGATTDGATTNGASRPASA
jgi:hypothetical protein